MSGESHPILSGAIPAWEQFMTTWEKLSDEQPHLAPLIKKGLDWAYLYYGRMDHTRAYVIAMCKWNHSSSPLRTTQHCIDKVLNPAYRMSWIMKHWGRDYIGKAETIIRQTVSLFRFLFLHNYLMVW
jgi:hypothetical protein